MHAPVAGHIWADGTESGVVAQHSSFDWAAVTASLSASAADTLPQMHDGNQQPGCLEPLETSAGPPAATGDPPALRLKVLARIPDVGDVQSIPIRQPEAAAAISRIIGQSLAAKLLLGGTMLLMAAAVLPSLFGGKAGPTSAEDSTPQWQPANTALTASIASTLGQDRPALAASMGSAIGQGGPALSPSVASTLGQCGPALAASTSSASGPRAGELPTLPPDMPPTTPPTNLPVSPPVVGQWPNPGQSPPAAGGVYLVTPSPERGTAASNQPMSLASTGDRYQSGWPEPSSPRVPEQAQASANRPMALGESAASATPDRYPNYRPNDPGGSRLEGTVQ